MLGRGLTGEEERTEGSIGRHTGVVGRSLDRGSLSTVTNSLTRPTRSGSLHGVSVTLHCKELSLQ